MPDDHRMSSGRDAFVFKGKESERWHLLGEPSSERKDKANSDGVLPEDCRMKN
jgi:hypothetical protein